MKEENLKPKSKTTTDSPKEITIGDYIIKKTIGSGTFSTVKLGVHRITQKKVAIKILDKNKIESRDDLERIIREMQILTEMHNPFVIKVYKIYEDKNNFLIIMEYCEGGELFNYIVKKKRLSEDESSYFFFQLINGIEYIHSKGIAHRDLKPENLLLSKNKILKIIDFGLSNFYDGQKRLQTPCGSPCYASPEMVKGKKYDGFNIDIWAIGVILFAMLCGYLPFEDDENDTDVLFNEIIRNKIDYPYFLSKLSLDILKRILVSDPLQRITIEEIKNHEFYLKGEKIFRNKFEEKEDEQNVQKNNKDQEKEKEKEKEKETMKEKEKEKEKESMKEKEKEKDNIEKKENETIKEKEKEKENIEKKENETIKEKEKEIKIIKENETIKEKEKEIIKEEIKENKNKSDFEAKNIIKEKQDMKIEKNNTNNNIETDKKELKENTDNNNINNGGDAATKSNDLINKFFTKIDKKEIKDRNISRPKGPITIILKNEENNNYPINNTHHHQITNTTSNEIKSRNNHHTLTNKENKILPNNIKIISTSNNAETINKYTKTNNNISNNNKINFLMHNKNNKNEIGSRNGMMKIFGLKNKKKLFTKLKLKNHKFIRYDIKNIINTEGKTNKINLKYNINLDNIKKAKNSFEKNELKYEIDSYKKSILNNANINNLKIVDNKSKSKDKEHEISLKKKLIKYNIMGLKQYNNLVNNINININNISRSAKKDKFEPSFTNNNIINLNVILNNTSNNNNKNINSLQINNDGHKTKKYIPVTPSQMRFIPSKKSTLPSITISDRIKPKINAKRFKSINANKYYLNTESNYERIERQKKIFLDNVFKKYENLRQKLKK